MAEIDGVVNFEANFNAMVDRAVEGRDVFTNVRMAPAVDGAARSEGDGSIPRAEAQQLARRFTVLEDASLESGRWRLDCTGQEPVAHLASDLWGSAQSK